MSYNLPNFDFQNSIFPNLFDDMESLQPVSSSTETPLEDDAVMTNSVFQPEEQMIHSQGLTASLMDPIPEVKDQNPITFVFSQEKPSQNSLRTTRRKVNIPTLGIAPIKSKLPKMLRNVSQKSIEEYVTGRNYPLSHILKPYQASALFKIKQLKKRGVQGAILGLEMGLGKTVVISAFLRELQLNREGPMLVVGTKSIIAQLEDSIQSWVKQDIDQSNQNAVQNYFDSCLVKYIKNRIRKEDVYVARSVYIYICALWEYLSPKVQGIISNNLYHRLKNYDNNIGKPSAYQKKGLKQRAIKEVQAIVGTPFPQSKDCFISRTLLCTGKVGSPKKMEQKIVFATYEDLKRDVLKKIPFGAIVVDESQKVKNAQTRTSKSLVQLIKLNRIKGKCFILHSTGTPFENNLPELVNYIHMIEVEEKIEWGKGFNSFKYAISNQEKIVRKTLVSYALKEISLEVAYKNIRSYFCSVQALKSVVKRLIIRRLRSDPLIQKQWKWSLPHVKSKRHKLTKISSASQKVFQEISEDAQKRKGWQWWDDKGQMKMSAVFRMSRALFHPELSWEKMPEDFSMTQFTSNLKQKFSTKEGFDRWTEQSNLLSKISDDLTLEKATRGCVFFANQKSVANAMQVWLPYAMKYKFEMKVPPPSIIEGSKNVSSRKKSISKFESIDDKSTKFLILMVQAASAGIDLCNNGEDAYMLFHTFNPGTIDQAESRIIRSGEKMNVRIHRYTYQTGVENYLDHIIRAKMIWRQHIFGSVKSKEELIPNKEELLNLFDEFLEANISSIRFRDILEIGEQRILESRGEIYGYAQEQAPSLLFEVNGSNPFTDIELPDKLYQKVVKPKESPKSKKRKGSSSKVESEAKKKKVTVSETTGASYEAATP